MLARRNGDKVFIFSDRENAEEECFPDYCDYSVCLPGFTRTVGVEIPEDEVIEFSVSVNLTPEQQKKIAEQAKKNIAKELNRAQKRAERAAAALAEIRVAAAALGVE